MSNILQTSVIIVDKSAIKYHVYAATPLHAKDNSSSDILYGKYVVLHTAADYYDACVNTVNLGQKARLHEFRSETHSRIFSRRSPDKNPECPSSGECSVIETQQITTSGDRKLNGGQEGNHKCHADEPSYECDDTEIAECDLFPKVTKFRNRLPCNFILAHINIDSFRHKSAYVSDILRKKQVDFLEISETKLDSSFPKSQFDLGDYVLYRQDLTSSSGGLIVYVRDDLPHRRLCNTEINEDGYESFCIELTIGKYKTVVTCV